MPDQDSLPSLFKEAFKHAKAGRPANKTEAIGVAIGKCLALALLIVISWLLLVLAFVLVQSGWRVAASVLTRLMGG